MPDPGGLPAHRYLATHPLARLAATAKNYVHHPPAARSYLALIGMLKHVCQIEHTRHSSFPGFEANLCSGLIAYSFLPNRSKIHLKNGSAAILQTML